MCVCQIEVPGGTFHPTPAPPSLRGAPPPEPPGAPFVAGAAEGRAVPRPFPHHGPWGAAWGPRGSGRLSSAPPVCPLLPGRRRRRDGGCSPPPRDRPPLDRPPLLRPPMSRRRPGRESRVRRLKNPKEKKNAAVRCLLPISEIQVYWSMPCGHRACSDCLGKLKMGETLLPSQRRGLLGDLPLFPPGGGGGKWQKRPVQLTHRSVCGRGRGDGSRPVRALWGWWLQ